MRLEEYVSGFNERDWDTGSEGTVRYAVVGLGDFALNRILPGLAAAERAAATVVVSGEAEKAERIAGEFGATHALTYDEFADGVAVDEYDAVYVATPPGRHLDDARVAAEHGKHVHCEKPMEATRERAGEMADVCADAGVELMIAYRVGTQPAIRRLRGIVEEGFVGEPVAITGTYTGRSSAADDPDAWRVDPDLAGGGALMDIGVYVVRTVRTLLDDDPEAVLATTATPDPGFEPVDEHATVQLPFAGGATATAAASFNAASDTTLRILGTEGRLTVESAFGSRARYEITVERDGTRWSFVPPETESVVEDLEYFAHAVLAGETPEANGADALVDMDVLSAAYESAETGERIPL